MKNYFLILIVFMGILLVQCEEDQHEPVNNDSVAPGVIQNVRVNNLPGAATIKYNVPADEDLLYVQAEYTLKNGREMKVKASVYVDSLLCEGFGTTDQYDITLYAVDRAGNFSNPVVQVVQPLEPPINGVLENMVLQNTFGGVNIRWENKTQSPVGIFVMIKDTTDSAEEFLEVGSIFTQTLNGNINFRGFDTKTRDFYYFVKDRWDNYSDTIVKSITPFFEVQLDKGLMREVILPNDLPMHAIWESGGSRIPRIWDGNLAGDGARIAGISADFSSDYFFTFDLGVTAKLSRFTIFQFLGWNDQYLYEDAQVKTFELYGTANLDLSGAWDTWKKIGDYEIIKPSGLPTALWNYTDEDKAAAYNGHEFEVPLELEPVRYIRMKITSVWGATSWASFAEIDIFGQPESN